MIQANEAAKNMLGQHESHKVPNMSYAILQLHLFTFNRETYVVAALEN